MAPCGECGTELIQQVEAELTRITTNTIKVTSVRLNATSDNLINLKRRSCCYTEAIVLPTGAFTFNKDLLNSDSLSI